MAQFIFCMRYQKGLSVGIVGLFIMLSIPPLSALSLPGECTNKVGIFFFFLTSRRQNNWESASRSADGFINFRVCVSSTSSKYLDLREVASFRKRKRTNKLLPLPPVPSEPPRGEAWCSWRSPRERWGADHFHSPTPGGGSSRKSSRLELSVARKFIEHLAHGAFEAASAKVSLLLLMLSCCLRVIMKTTHTEGKKKNPAGWVGVILILRRNVPFVSRG